MLIVWSEQTGIRFDVRLHAAVGWKLSVNSLPPQPVSLQASKQLNCRVCDTVYRHVD